MVTEPTAVAVRESQPPVIVPRTLQEMIEIAERLAKSSLLPEALRGKVPEVLMQIMAGQELGLYSMASLRSFHIIQGKPVMAADAMVAVVLGSGKAEYFRRVGEGTDKSVTYATKRKGQEEQRCTWTHEMAVKAALHQKDNWRLFERQMLASRAKSELARDVYPDVLAGCYSIDEVADQSLSTPTRGPVGDVVDAEFTETKIEPAPFSPADYPEIAALDSAESVTDMQAQAAKFAARKLNSGPVYEVMKERYKLNLARVKAKYAEAQPEIPASSSSASTGEG